MEKLITNAQTKTAADQSQIVITDWDIFVLRHKSPVNTFFHLLSALMFWLGPILCLFLSNPWWIMLLFLSSPVGSIGHLLADDGPINIKEATSSLQALKFSTAMSALFVLGKFSKHILSAKKKFKLYLEGNACLGTNNNAKERLSKKFLEEIYHAKRT